MKKGATMTSMTAEDRERALSAEFMRIEIKDGTIVINDDIVTDFEVYKQLYNLEIKQLVQDGEECSICLLPFKADQAVPVVKSCIEHVLQSGDELRQEDVVTVEQSVRGYEYECYHLQCFNQHFKQDDIITFTEHL